MNCEYIPTNEHGWLGIYSKNMFDNLIEKFSCLLIIVPLSKNQWRFEKYWIGFFATKTISKIQPRHAGIIWAFKMHYRRQFYRNLLEGYEIGIPNPEKTNVLDAMNLAISASTIDVQESIIANCFWHCKIRFMDNAASEKLDQHSDDRGVQ